ncbi:MAG: rane protein [Candidatus Kaiserbacteria bacterium]|nr:rane protein [Candidatus Kaiserbacteria bacterium]
MRIIFIAISSILALISPLIYARAILRGEARPHRTTRLVLFLITALTTLSLFAQHDRVAIWLAGASFIQAFVIFVLSLRYGMGGWAKTDILCLVIALAGIVLWQTTANPALGLYAAILADFTGMIPALIKTYHQPETEIASFYALDVLAALFSLLALSIWVPQGFAYPLYILIINTCMVMLVVRPRRPRE